MTSFHPERSSLCLKAARDLLVVASHPNVDTHCLTGYICLPLA